jgi:hypothetical protein
MLFISVNLRYHAEQALGDQMASIQTSALTNNQLPLITPSRFWVTDSSHSDSEKRRGKMSDIKNERCQLAINRQQATFDKQAQLARRVRQRAR